MFFEVSVKRTVMDDKGRDKQIVEKLIVENCEFFAEAEAKALQEFNSECDVVAIKISSLKEFVNREDDIDFNIYFSTIESGYVDVNTGKEVEFKYKVAVFAQSIEEAQVKTKEYMRQGLDDMTLVSIKKTKFTTLI